MKKQNKKQIKKPKNVYELWNVVSEQGSVHETFEEILDFAIKINYLSDYYEKYFLVLELKTGRLLKTLTVVNGAVSWTTHAERLKK